MAPEPVHLVNITKNCPCCNSTVVKFLYFNNHKIAQPRYKCKRCGQFFTYGGKCRAALVVNPSRTSTTSTAVVSADRLTGPVQRGRPRSQRVTHPQEMQETPATCARTEAGTAATCARTEARTRAARNMARPSTGARTEAETAATRARTEARTRAARNMARPSTGALRLRRIPILEQPESPVQSPIQSPVVSPVQSPVENPAVRRPVPTARIAGLVPGDVVDVGQSPASRTAATVIAEGGDVMVNWTKAVLGVSPYGLAPARNGKRMRVMRIKCQGKESVLSFWVEDSHAE